MAATTVVVEYAMPSLGADMDEGSVVEWRVGVGDRVARGDVVARVETEKSDIDIEIWLDGVVSEVLVTERRVVPVGTPLLLIETVDDGSTVGPGPAPTGERGSGPAAVEPAGSTLRRPDSGDAHMGALAPAGTVLASPLARSVAAERGIDLATVAGSGPNGAVVSADILNDVASTDVPTDVASTDVPTDVASPGLPTDAPSRDDRMRRAIAARMSRSNTDIPHYFLDQAVDVTALLAELAARNESLEPADRLIPAAAFLRATALAAARHRELNGHWVDDAFRRADAVDVGVAVSIRGGGLMTPVIAGADGIDLASTMSQLRTMTAGVRTGVLRSGATDVRSSITVTMLGDRGADLVHGLISPPEVALVGFGRIVERPWVVDGAVSVRSIVHASLSADHRATDGATGSRFLASIARLLEHPEEL
ncbi:MAG: dihydrolipoamide acetyltransferase family protein [Actinomycetota bacterium]